MKKEIGFIIASDTTEISDYLSKHPELVPLNVETKKDFYGNPCYCLWFLETGE